MKIAVRETVNFLLSRNGADVAEKPMR